MIKKIKNLLWKIKYLPYRIKNKELFNDTAAMLQQNNMLIYFNTYHEYLAFNEHMIKYCRYCRLSTHKIDERLWMHDYFMNPKPVFNIQLVFSSPIAVNYSYVGSLSIVKKVHPNCLYISYDEFMRKKIKIAKKDLMKILSE